MIESVAGIMNAAPTPWMAREATSQPSVGARPIVAEASAKTTTPNRNMRRRPKMSPSRPPVTSSTAKVSVYALTVHSRAESDASKSRWIDGSATFTTVLSSMIMNSAKHIAPSVHQRRLSSERRSRSVMGRDPFDDGEEGVVQRGPLVVRELGRELDERRLAGGGQPVEHLAAVGEQGDQLGAAVVSRLAPGRRSRAATSPSTERDMAGSDMESRSAMLLDGLPELASR